MLIYEFGHFDFLLETNVVFSDLQQIGELPKIGIFILVDALQKLLHLSFTPIMEK
jgi:hypothetical protein